MTQWIRTKTRVRIYARDTPDGQKSPACTYCGRAVRIGQLPSDSEAGLAAAVLDHVIPGGPNSQKNLVTACWSCNADKGKLNPDQWEDRRLKNGQSRKPRWRARRPEPALSLAGRALAAVRRPLCQQKEGQCAAQLELLGEQRQATVDDAARRRRRGGR